MSSAVLLSSLMPPPPSSAVLPVTALLRRVSVLPAVSALMPAPQSTEVLPGDDAAVDGEVLVGVVDAAAGPAATESVTARDREPGDGDVGVARSVEVEDAVGVVPLDRDQSGTIDGDGVLDEQPGGDGDRRDAGREDDGVAVGGVGERVAEGAGAGVTRVGDGDGAWPRRLTAHRCRRMRPPRTSPPAAPAFEAVSAAPAARRPLPRMAARRSARLRGMHLLVHVGTLSSDRNWMCVAHDLPVMLDRARKRPFCLISREFRDGRVQRAGRRDRGGR